jgi:hypothetical protein
MDELAFPGPESAPVPPSRLKGRAKSFNCPACGGVVTIHAVGHSISAVCSHCSSVVDVANDNYKIVEKANRLTRHTLLEIGRKGELFGVTWEVIGYVEKNDGSAAYRWEEYLLYNPYHGFRFLVQARGHWNLFEVIKRDVSGADLKDEVSLGEQKYAIFYRGEAVVQYVKGEFYWSVKKGDRVRVVDYIAPPHMLSVEMNDEEITLAQGEYLEPSQVKEAFKLTAAMPYPIGVAPNQPSRFRDRTSGIRSVALIGFLAATLIQIATSVTADNAQVYATQSRIYSENAPAELVADGCSEAGGGLADCDKAASYGKNKMFSTPSFILPKESNVFIESYSPVQNDWVELNVSLVNEQTNTAYSLSHGIEYYFGNDSDGYWSEGNQRVDSFISAVPSGTYRLLVEADSGAFQKSGAIDFALNVKRDVPVWGNYWITLLLLLVYPGYAGIRHLSFENKRWSESDYAPALYRPSEG